MVASLNNWLGDEDKDVVGFGCQSMVATMHHMIEKRMIVGPENRSSTVYWCRTNLVGRYARIPSERLHRRVPAVSGRKDGHFRR